MADVKVNPIVVVAEQGERKILWGFTISNTGQLDYHGKIDDEIDLKDYQQLESSTYFSESAYCWISPELCFDIHLFIANDVAIESADAFAFLTHIGAILLAIDSGDTLLAAELFDRRKMIFSKFSEICRYIFEPIAPYVLFAWVYGGFSDEAEFNEAYKKMVIFDDSMGTSVFLYWAAKKLLTPNPAKETAEEMFIRFFSDEDRDAAQFSMGVVGVNHNSWLEKTEKFFKSIPKLALEKDFVDGTNKLREAKNRLFSELKFVVQAEPYNPFDFNAISVLAEDVEAKVSGFGGMCKVGYLRATGAAILRKALPNTFAFKSVLCRISSSWKASVVVKMEV